MSNQTKPQRRISSVLEDPGSKAVSQIYAEAFLGAAGDGQADALLEELTSFHDDVLGTQPEYARLLMSGLLGREEVLRLIERTMAGVASELFVNFLRVLARHNRLALIPMILRAAHLRREEELGHRRVVVTSAIALSEESRQRLRERLAAHLPFDPILVPQVDPQILGGLMIQVGDTVYDTSLRTRLAQLRNRLRRRSLHEIQSGRDRFGHSA